MENKVQLVDVTDTLPKCDRFFGEEFVFDDIRLYAIKQDNVTAEEASEAVELALQSLTAQVNNLLTDDISHWDLVKVIKDAQDRSRHNFVLAAKELGNTSTGDALSSSLSGYVEKRIDNKVRRLPVVKDAASNDFIHRINAETKEICQQVERVSTLLYSKRIDLTKFKGETKREAVSLVQTVKGLSPNQATAMVMYVIALKTNLLFENIQARVIREYERAKIQVDEVSDGLWVEPKSDGCLAELTSKSRVIITQVRLNSKQVYQLKTICFSKSPILTGKAKMDLYSTLKNDLATRIQKNPERELVLALSAASLTHMEVLALLFDVENVNEKEFRCPECCNLVNIGHATYHPDCSVVKWLIKNFFFHYDNEQRVLVPRRATYLSPGQRATLNAIMEKARNLNAWITRVTADSTEAWQVTAEGKVTKTATTTAPRPSPNQGNAKRNQ